jgi:hypothetical protein
MEAVVDVFTSVSELVWTYPSVHDHSDEVGLVYYWLEFVVLVMLVVDCLFYDQSVFVKEVLE